MSSRLLLDENNLCQYLVDRGLAEDAESITAERLGGGVSCDVFLAHLGNSDVVVKQPLERLRVAEEWLYDTNRVHAEYQCMRLLGEILPPGAVPDVRHFDDVNGVIMMTAIHSDGSNWKERLLSGVIEPERGARVGRLLGIIHERTRNLPRLAALFPDSTNFIEGRIDPYFCAIRSMHSDLGEAIDAIIDRLVSRKEALVHGDFSPKNILCDKGKSVFLDFEVAHHGDPIFDVAFCLTHFTMKAIWLTNRRGDCINLAKSFLTAYRSAIDVQLDEEFLRSVLGGLLIARVDGKSPAEYLIRVDARDAVREIGRALLSKRIVSLDELWPTIDRITKPR